MYGGHKVKAYEFRNTITGMKESPAELLMSRKLRSRIPTGKNSLQPRISADAKKSLCRRKQDQKRFYDLQEGKEWYPAVDVSKHDTPRSLNILTPDGRMLDEISIIWLQLGVGKIESEVDTPFERRRNFEKSATKCFFTG
uniref:uncharacterized protein LOC120329816 n=1 Tax=Styela clava TaxID=7725 RepID=UPI00193950A7|nr:uncharacterized protein LOC120329816 [Styela clava]